MSVCTYVRVYMQFYAAFVWGELDWTAYFRMLLIGHCVEQAENSTW